MIEQNGNIWDYYSINIVAITTNGILNNKKELIMGKGIALEAKNRNNTLPLILGKLVSQYGNRPFLLDKILSFPTKNHWRDKSDINLIKESAKLAVELVKGEIVYMPRPGCGCGGLKWEYVKSNLLEILPDNFIILS